MAKLRGKLGFILRVSVITCQLGYLGFSRPVPPPLSSVLAMVAASKPVEQLTPFGHALAGALGGVFSNA
jgi:hypothetical protein